MPKPETEYDVFVEASDLAQLPTPELLQQLVEKHDETGEPQHTEFPSSGSIMPHPLLQDEVDGILDICKWLYRTANEEIEEDEEILTDSEGDTNMQCPTPNRKSRKILLHCADGYTETSLVALAYIMYAERLTAHEAWLSLHRDKGRNFFAYLSDLSLLIKIQPEILKVSPRQQSLLIKEIPNNEEPPWLQRMDGSLPSRILPYMYLGNLIHANNPELLKAMGIKRILSVGEAVSWTEQEERDWGSQNILYIDRVQDNGVDPLIEDFDRCLQFIEEGKSDGGATLVHCRVGVSRSATICIAEVMRTLGLSFPRAYCYVRARRLNVIIQPHLRFAYELLKWEELQPERRALPVKRELEWANITREIARMNRPYSR
jgi:dual specificity MAP kinase phosphatase